MDTILAWHFTDGPTLRDGSPLPPVGEWLVHDGPVAICESGLHASRRLIDALDYAPGTLCHRVEIRGVVAEHSDKLVARERRVIASCDATATLRAWSRRCALQVIDLWDCPLAVRAFLEAGENVDAAAEAAWAAAAARVAWAAAEAAARDEQNAELVRLMLTAMGLTNAPIARI